MPSQLYQVALNAHSGDPTTKPLPYYQRYDDFLNHHQIEPKNILEIGTYLGESAKILAKNFPESKILTVDVMKQHIDFKETRNVNYEIVDQTDSTSLRKLIKKYFPKGIDLVIDDASHYGYLSKQTFEIVFPFLNSGGAYFIEDWGTGYWDSWFDGNRFQEFPLVTHHDNIPRRIPSHDFGMVGFVKSLVDLAHESAIKNNQSDLAKNISRLSVIEFGEGVCMLKKA